MKRSAIRAVFPDTIPVLTGYLFLGAGFGILLVESGYSVLWAAVMALLIFAGSGQYLLVGLLASGASLASAAVATLLVNVRHLFYGISLVDAYKTAGKRRFYMIFGLTDETYSLVTQAKIPEGISREDYCFWVTLLNHGYWVAATAVGALFGNLLTFDTTGMDFALTALFVVLFMEQWKKRENRPSGLVGIACAALALAVFGAENMVIPAMIMILAVLLGGRRHLCR